MSEDGRPPHHIGIILDGKSPPRGGSLGITEPRELYDLGANKLDEVARLVRRARHSDGDLMGFFSTDNFRRPRGRSLGDSGPRSRAKLRGAPRATPAIHRRRVRCGGAHRLPSDAARAGVGGDCCGRACDRRNMTASSSTFAIAYGGPPGDSRCRFARCSTAWAD